MDADYCSECGDEYPEDQLQEVYIEDDGPIQVSPAVKVCKFCLRILHHRVNVEPPTYTREAHCEEE